MTALMITVFTLFFISFLSCEARYCDDPEQAEVFYHHALVLVPSNGKEDLIISITL